MAHDTLESAPQTAPPCDPPAAPSAGGDGKLRRQRGLALIAAYKLVHATFFFLLGLVALHLVHKDLAAVLLRLGERLRFNPEHHLFRVLLEHVSAVDAKRLHQLGLLSFADSALALVEGVGLFYEQAWAEWLTVLVTGSFIPWEIYELVRHPSPFRLILLLGNSIVLTYLIWTLRNKGTR
jgi:uncharacterized membrane protein (DUF2068 family)